MVGQLRKGKSYVMNMLAQKTGANGFELGHTHKSVTNGIWAYILPKKEADESGTFTTVLLDTQGLDDPYYANPATTSGRIFMITALLSSYLVFNVVSQL